LDFQRAHAVGEFVSDADADPGGLYRDIELLAHAENSGLVGFRGDGRVSGGVVHDAVQHAALGVERGGGEFEGWYFAVLRPLQ